MAGRRSVITIKNSEGHLETGEDNEEEGLNGQEFPSYTIINIGSGYQLTSQLRIQFLLENILDTFYKPFASGIAGPGRNFIFTLRVTI